MSSIATLPDALAALVRDAVRDAVTDLPMRREVRLLRAREVAERLGVSERMVDAMVADGRLASVKVGHARRVRSDVLDAYIESLGGGG